MRAVCGSLGIKRQFPPSRVLLRLQSANWLDALRAVGESNFQMRLREKASKIDREHFEKSTFENVHCSVVRG